MVTAKCRCGVEWYSGWLASVGVDVARLRLDSPRVAWPSPFSSPPVNPTTVSHSLPLPLPLSPVTLFISRCTFRLPQFLSFHRRFLSPSPPFYLVLVSFFLFSRPYREESPISPFPFLYASFRSYYRSRTFSRRCPPSRGHKIQPGILISPPLCRAVQVPTDYFDPARDHSRFGCKRNFTLEMLSHPRFYAPSRVS